jgi:3-hydroxybutyryl-CoA dehydrogenase
MGAWGKPVMISNIRTVGVLGSGIMGAGIAQSFLEQGFDVILVDQNEDVLNKAKTNISASMAKRFEKNILSQCHDVSTKLSLSTNLDDLVVCDLVVEAVPENFELKTKILQQIDALLPESKILATNTSSLSVTTLAEKLVHKKRFLGIHYMNPVIKIPLIELIFTDVTPENLKTDLHTFFSDMGRVPVVTKDTPGFIVNAILIPMINSSIKVLEQNIATAEDIDKAMTTGANFPIGPLALADLIGLDTILSIMQILQRSDPVLNKPVDLLVTMVKNEKLGRKTGEGFYSYV